MHISHSAIGLTAARLKLLLVTACLTLASCAPSTPQTAGPDGNWQNIFDGQSLSGWHSRIANHEAGVNHADTFRVENGILKVSYDKYSDFGKQTGALFYTKPLSKYWLRVEYRFTGGQSPGAPGWAFRDSGLLIHAQSPDTLSRDQEFPVSIEMNFLGGKLGSRPTGDVCTNSTKVVLSGQLRDDCGNTSTVTMRGKRWVTAEVEVLGGKSIRHFVNGQLVTQYEEPQLDEKSPDASRLLATGTPKLLTSGYIAIQSNGAELEVRKIELLNLAQPTSTQTASQP